MTKYSKSEVMKRAWSIYKAADSCYASSFSESLSRAWEIIKANVASRERKANEQALQDQMRKAKRGSVMFDMNILANSLTNYYANNTYNGD